MVAHHCLAHNQFHELQKAADDPVFSADRPQVFSAQVILDFDPSLRRVQEYLNSVKARPGSDKSQVACFNPWKQPRQTLSFFEAMVFAERRLNCMPASCSTLLDTV